MTGTGKNGMGHGIKALVFDVFGTLVDWRGSIAREGEAWGRPRGLAVDWAAFADAWRAAYHPSMDKVRRGERPRAERLLANIERSVSVGARASVLRVELLLDGGRAHEALASAEGLDRAHPTVTVVKNLLGLARAAVGDRVGAREAFEAALRLDPHAGDPLVNMARLQREAGDRSGAKAVFLENVPGVMEHMGAIVHELSVRRKFQLRWTIVRASDVGAPHVATGHVPHGVANR